MEAINIISAGAWFIIAGGISLCIAGFRKAGLPLNRQKRITGRPARIIGLLSLIISLTVAIVLFALSASVHWKLY